MRLMIRRRFQGEEGFTMVVVVMAMVVVTLALFAAVSAVNGDLRGTQRDLDRKQAYEAAEAGIADYQYHLNTDTNYWTRCATVPTPTAVNQIGSTVNRKPVPGGTGATYAIELIPATGASCNTTNPSASMIEPVGSTAPGTFRIRSTGYAGGTQQRVVATFRRSSFLDYVYFTQRETSDPVTYGFTGTAEEGANSQCSLSERDGRYAANIPGTSQQCDRIYFTDGENVKGPLHTNDYLAISGVPTFGRRLADAIEVGAPDPGFFPPTATPNFVGKYKTGAAILTPPVTNGALAQLAGTTTYSGTTRIVLGSTSMTVTTASGTSTAPIPTNGVVYISQAGSCGAYSPFAPDTGAPVNGKGPIYPAIGSGCGTVYVSGTYNYPLTIAAENDVIVEGNLCRGSCGSTSGNGLVGLIANNFIRVAHKFSTQTSKSGGCGSGSNTGTTVGRIDAAMLAISHSFIVDHYNCGNPLGTLNVHGAISQKYRGPVGTFNGSGAASGYTKNYDYDDRLQFISPPNFLDPITAPWRVQRQTIDP